MKMILVSHLTHHFSIEFFPKIDKNASAGKIHFRGITWSRVAKKKKKKRIHMNFNKSQRIATSTKQIF